MISFGSRIGSPAMKGERAIEPVISLVASGRSLRRMKEVAGGRFRPGLPLHIVRRDRLAEADVGLGDQNIDRLYLGDRLGRRRGLLSDPLAR